MPPLDLLGQIFHTHKLQRRPLCRIRIGALSKYGYAHVFTGTVWQSGRAAHHLVGFTRVNTQVNRGLKVPANLTLDNSLSRATASSMLYSLLESTLRGSHVDAWIT